MVEGGGEGEGNPAPVGGSGLLALPAMSTANLDFARPNGEQDGTVVRQQTSTNQLPAFSSMTDGLTGAGAFVGDVAGTPMQSGGTVGYTPQEWVNAFSAFGMEYNDTTTGDAFFQDTVTGGDKDVTSTGGTAAGTGDEDYF